MSTPNRVAVIGLDCGTPQLLFDSFASEMPNLAAHISQSQWGPLRSTMPAITVPAWSCLFSGRTPGELGIYGFRNRADHTYGNLSVATSRNVQVPRLWDVMSQNSRDSVLLGIPGTYPIPKGISGSIVSDFLTPSGAAAWTYPISLADDLDKAVGPYIFDVSDFRSEDKSRIAQQVFDMTEQRFAAARYLLATRSWDLFAMVDMGPDRLHHGFWATFDPAHARYDPHSPYATLFRDYYRMVDGQLGQLFEALPDDTAVLLVSDHGAQPMVGGFCINEWLLRQGLLRLRSEPTVPTAIASAPIDWPNTVAWADGGYYARVFLNVAGREPAGLVAPQAYEETRDWLIGLLQGLHDHEGRPMGNRAFRPEELYPEVNGVAPDLIVYLGDLRWRSVGTLGIGDGLYTFKNDTGPDDANHAEFGVFALRGDGLPTGRVDDLSIYDVAPTLQRVLGLDAPPSQTGRVLV